MNQRNDCRKQPDTKIREIAYARFQWWWLMSHGYTVNDISALIQEWASSPEGLPEMPFRDYLEEYGFGGSIWPCMGEFLTAEYLDHGLMQTILDEREYASYLREVA